MSKKPRIYKRKVENSGEFFAKNFGSRVSFDASVNLDSEYFNDLDYVLNDSYFK